MGRTHVKSPLECPQRAPGALVPCTVPTLRSSHCALWEPWVLSLEFAKVTVNKHVVPPMLAGIHESVGVLPWQVRVPISLEVSHDHVHLRSSWLSRMSPQVPHSNQGFQVTYLLQDRKFRALFLKPRGNTTGWPSPQLNVSVVMVTMACHSPASSVLSLPFYWGSLALTFTRIRNNPPVCEKEKSKNTGSSNT